jgi:hypothetical protein
MTVAKPELVIPQIPWPEIRRRLQTRWVVREASHHSIIAKTRAGKSYLIRHGILDICRYDRVLILDAKGDDPTFRGLGQPVTNLPSRVGRALRTLFHPDDRIPYQDWYRLILTGEDAKEKLHRALERVLKEGDWIVVSDELRVIVDAREPGLGERGLWEAMRLRGGYKGVGLVDSSQEPKWLPSSFYTQSEFYWISRIEDEAVHKRIGEIGTSRALLPHLSRVPQHHWIYTDNLDGERFWALTKVP